MKRNIILFLVILHAFALFADSKNSKVITLREAIELSLKNNPTIIKQKYIIEKSFAQIRKAYSAVIPSLNVNFQYTLNDEEVAMDTSKLGAPCGEEIGFPCREIVLKKQHIVNSQVTFNFPILFPQAISIINLSYMGKKLTELSVEETKRVFIVNLIKVYYATVSAKHIMELSRNSLESALSHLRAVEAKYNVEQAVRIDLARAQYEVEASKERLKEAEATYSNYIDTLKRFMGISLDNEIDVVEPNFEIDENLSFSSFIKEGVMEHPLINIKKLLIEIEKENIKKVWFSFLPILSVNWIYNYELTEPTGFGARKSYWMTLFTLTLPLYDGGNRYGELRERKGELMLRELELEEERQRVSLEIKIAYRNWKSALEKVELAKRQKELAEESLKLVESAYNVGIASSFELMDAQRRTIDSQINFELQRLNSQLSLIELLDKAGKNMLKLIYKSSR